MGGGASKGLEKSELELCLEIANTTSLGTKKKKKLVENLSSLKKKGVLKDCATHEELLQMLLALGYFETEYHRQKKAIKHKQNAQRNLKMLKEVTENKQYQQDTAKILFRTFDMDRSGVVTIKEFLTGYVNFALGDETEKYSYLFELWDLDGNHELTVNEIENMIQVSLNNELVFSRVTLIVLLYVTNSEKVHILNPNASHEEVDRIFQLQQQVALPIIDQYFDQVKAKRTEHLEEFVRSFINIADTNKNGTISKSEFLNFYSDSERVSFFLQSQLSCVADLEVPYKTQLFTAINDFYASL